MYKRKFSYIEMNLLVKEADEDMFEGDISLRIMPAGRAFCDSSSVPSPKSKGKVWGAPVAAGLSIPLVC